MRTTVAIGVVGLLTACGVRFPDFEPDHTPPSTRARYEISVIEFGRAAPRKKRDLVRRGKVGLAITPVWRYVLARGNGRVVVFDPGFHTDDTAMRFDTTEHVRPDAPLAELGLRAEDVTDVFLTHFARNRAEAVDLYPRATFYVQSGAYERARYLLFARRASQRAQATTSGLRYLERKDEAGRLVRLDGNVEVFEGVKVYAAHLIGEWYSYYAVRGPDGVYVIPGDVVPLWENVARRRGVPNIQGALPVFEHMRRLAQKTERIVPAIDPGLERRWRRVSGRVLQPRSSNVRTTR